MMKILNINFLKMRFYFKCIIFFIIIFQEANARPISYPNSWTLMEKDNWERTQIHIHYTPNIKNSVGFLGSYYKDDKSILTGIQWNHLLHRNNQKKSQSNLYSKIHLGNLERKSIYNISKNNNIHLGFELSYDWETRKYFFLYNPSVQYEYGENKIESYHKFQFGFTPYLADYGSLHTWIMVQLDYNPEDNIKDNNIIITPLLRFFKKDILLEIGVDSNKKLLLNSILRF